MKCLYECLDEEWFKCALATAKDLKGDYAVSYLLGMRSAIKTRYDLTQRQEKLYLHLITKEMGKKRK